MTSIDRHFFALIEKNIQFEIFGGESTLVGYPHTTGWRLLPFLVVAQTEYTGLAEFRDGTTATVKPGQGIALLPGVAHNLTKITRRAGYSHWVHLQCEVFAGVSLFSLIEPRLILKGAQAREVGRLNRELGCASAGEPSLERLLKRKALAWELILTLLRFASFREDRLALIRHASRLTPVLAYIEENLAQPLSHALLARVASLSPSRFHFLFRAALRVAPYEYVQKLRLKKAQQLLIRSDLPISQIAREVGHPDAYHFSRTFRRSFGMSPLQYRRQMVLPSF
jgi:AraC-like DNA-binding protein